MYKESPRRLPAEWEPQSGVMLTWPHDRTDWADMLDEVEAVFCNIAAAVTRHENLLVVARDTGHLAHIQAVLETAAVEMSRLYFYCVPSNDTWARDHGPIGIIDNDRPVLLDFDFNGWGNKFDAALDNEISRQLAAQQAFAGTSLRSHDLVLEGGSIDSDGNGTILTTTECLLAPTRNPALDRRAIEQQLHELLGAQRVLWLEHGMLLGDDTDSHIDMLARFCDLQTICYMSCKDKTDPHYAPLRMMQVELAALRQANGDAYRLVPLPLPDAMYDNDGNRLPGSYCNFLVINDAVLLPVYGVAQDDTAISTLRQCFPGRDIIPVQCRALIEQHGSLHCLSMQFPAGVLPG